MTQLILTYDPLDKLNSFVSTSDLTSLTTNCINKKIIQKHFNLFDLNNIKIGTLDTIDNIINYDNGTNDITDLSNIVIKIFLPSGIETYSVVYVENVIWNSEDIDVDNSSYNFNLSSVTGNQTFTKLQWIFTSRNKIPGIRTLIFT